MAAHHDSYDFSAWLPLVRQALLSALPMLPGAMAHAEQAERAAVPPRAVGDQAGAALFLHGIPCAIPAALACLSAGLPGASKVFLRTHGCIRRGGLGYRSCGPCPRVRVGGAL